MTKLAEKIETRIMRLRYCEHYDYKYRLLATTKWDTKKEMRGVWYEKFFEERWQEKKRFFGWSRISGTSYKTEVSSHSIDQHVFFGDPIRTRDNGEDIESFFAKKFSTETNGVLI